MNMHPAVSRSSIRQDHALITPESHVPLNFPDRVGCTTVYLITPHMGSAFSMYLVNFEDNGQYLKPLGEKEVLAYVLEGSGELSHEGSKALSAGSFFFLPPGCDLSVKMQNQSRILFFEKNYDSLTSIHPPKAIVSHESQVTREPFLGDEGALLQTLLPNTIEFDMAVNIFEFAPGGTLPMVENHYMEHGLYVLQGSGVYRLSESWYPVQQGDAIWMAPFCLQWYVAAGKTPTKYIYYKDMNRDPQF